ALASVATIPTLVLFTVVLLINRSTTTGSLESSTVRRNLEQKFVYWQDWSSESEDVKTLQEALQRERRAWEMTRQDTCSWEAGNPPASPQHHWGVGSQRCGQLASPKDRPPCWELVQHACGIVPSDFERGLLGQGQRCGLTWHAAYGRTSRTLGGALGEFSTPLSDASLCDDSRLGGVRSWTEEQQQSSLEWFRRNVQIYVLEMPGLVLNNGRETLASLGSQALQGTPVAGYDLNLELDLQAAVMDGSLPSGFDINHFKDQVGALSLAASHFHVQNLARRSGTPKPIVLVLEDGAVLAEDFRHKVWSLIQEETPCDWNVLSLSSSCPTGRCTSPHLARIGPNLEISSSERCRDVTSRGFRGMLYRTGTIDDFQNRWMQVAFDFAHPDCLSLDASLAAISDEVVLYAVPAVQSPGILKSC
ncbi:unnamed protein product, partial [Symbiodinium sp. KB8]